MKDRSISTSGQDAVKLVELCAFQVLSSLPRSASCDEIQIEVKREEVPPSRFDADSPPQLGMTSWVVTPEDGLAENPKIIFRRPPRAA